MADTILSNLVGTLRSSFRIGALRLVNAAGEFLEVRDKPGTLLKRIRVSAVALRTANGTNDVEVRIPSNPASALTYDLPVSHGAAGTVLSNDGAGVLSWERSIRVVATGSATLSAGAATVSTPAVAADSVILLGIQDVGGTFGALAVSGRTPGVSFSIASSSASDASTVAWILAAP